MDPYLECEFRCCERFSDWLWQASTDTKWKETTKRISVGSSTFTLFLRTCVDKESWSILSQKPRPLQDQLCFESGILLVIVFATGSRLFFLIWSTSWISPQLSCCNAGPKEVSVVSAPQSPIDHLVHPRVIFQKASVNFGAPATGRPMHRVWGILFEGRVLHRDAETQWLSELS